MSGSSWLESSAPLQRQVAEREVLAVPRTLTDIRSLSPLNAFGRLRAHGCAFTVTDLTQRWSQAGPFGGALRKLVVLVVLTSSAAAAAEALHFSLSGGAGIAHGIAGLKFEVQYGPVAAFAGLGLVRPAAGVRYYFGRSERGAGF